MLVHRGTSNNSCKKLRKKVLRQEREEDAKCFIEAYNSRQREKKKNGELEKKIQELQHKMSLETAAYDETLARVRQISQEEILKWKFLYVDFDMYSLISHNPSDHDFPSHSVYANFRLWKNHNHRTFAEICCQQDWTFLLNSWHFNQQTALPIRFPHWSPNVILYNFRANCDILTSSLTPTTPTFTTHNSYQTVKILITLRSLTEALKTYKDIDVGTHIFKHFYKFHNLLNQVLYLNKIILKYLTPSNQPHNSRFFLTIN